jgi:hypothetical protein
MNILCVGDVVGKPGRKALRELLPQLKQEYALDFIIVNAENAAGGSGLTSKSAKQFFEMGCDVLTLGDHVWDQKELEEYLKTSHKVLKPANFPKMTPGVGWCVIDGPRETKIGVVNLLGRVFMKYHVDCPFHAAQDIIAKIQEITPIIIVDFHAETTSEKTALGHFLDGKVSAVLGTHTHIQTADEKILPQQTAFITDLGMTGPYDSVIGQNKENIIKRFLTSMPVRFHVAKDDVQVHGVVISIDEKTGQARSIQRIQKKHIPLEAEHQENVSDS